LPPHPAHEDHRAGAAVVPPLRVAEGATVDHISHGRLIFGIGRSGFPRTYQAYGISYAESRERFAEVTEILKRAWTQERFSYDGQFYRFDDVCLTPKPFQAPHPELRIAVNSPDTFEQTGREGYPIFAPPGWAIQDLVPTWRPSKLSQGHRHRQSVSRAVYIAETGSRRARNRWRA
jgi:alkanesulfonate monooxygenase SsuD/methylene tetrahydromethanopterin reductase-like flavin-dependent oxidoreductase (luciferase family)